MIKNWKKFNRVNEGLIMEDGKQYAIVSLNNELVSIIRIHKNDTTEDIKFLVIESIQEEEGYSEVEFDISEEEINETIDYTTEGMVDGSIVNIHIISKNLYGSF